MRLGISANNSLQKIILRNDEDERLTNGVVS